jgi:transcriptional regulator with XRE-family HTH domain
MGTVAGTLWERIVIALNIALEPYSSQDKNEVLRMKKTKGFRKQIKTLQGSQTHAQFAKRLGVTESAVSAWRTGRDVPSTEKCLALAELAGYPQCFWFWERAGLRREKLLSAAERLLSELTKEPDSALVKDYIILVPCVRKTPEGLEPTGESVPMPAVKIPNPASTFCFLFQGESPSYTKFASIVDTTNADPEHFSDFIGFPILAEFDLVKFVATLPGLKMTGLPGARLRIGVLSWDDLFPPTEERRHLIACFTEMGEARGGSRLIIGTAVLHGALDAQTHPSQLIRPFPGFTILGRVIAP